MPPNWSKTNPVDIREDADYPRFASAIEITATDRGVDGLVVIFTPQGATDPTLLAKSIVKVAKTVRKPVLTAFIGGNDMTEARQIFDTNGVPTFEYPEDAIRTYLYMYNYARNLEILYETPEESPIVGATKNHIRAMIPPVASKRPHQPERRGRRADAQRVRHPLSAAGYRRWRRCGRTCSVAIPSSSRREMTSAFPLPLTTCPSK